MIAQCARYKDNSAAINADKVSQKKIDDALLENTWVCFILRIGFTKGNQVLKAF